MRGLSLEDLLHFVAGEAELRAWPLERQHGVGYRVAVQHSAGAGEGAVDLAVQQRFGAGLGAWGDHLAVQVHFNDTVGVEEALVAAAAGDGDARAINAHADIAGGGGHPAALIHAAAGADDVFLRLAGNVWQRFGPSRKAGGTKLVPPDPPAKIKTRPHERRGVWGGGTPHPIFLA